MSRIGNKPVQIPAGVEVAVNGNNVVVKGPKGQLELDVFEKLAINVEDNVLTVSRPDDERETRARHGLTRALIHNMVVGVSEGFEKKLELAGVGYRVQQKGKNLEFSLGFSHPVIVEAPEGITFEVPDNTHVNVKGINKQQVGQIAAEIRGHRPPEPYKGKGIHYVGEHIRRKLGKDAYAMTVTLLTDSQGKKMGKTAGNAVWLDPNKTSPFEFYQYWRNVGDADVMKCIRMLTFLPLEQIDEMSTWQDQRLNEAKEILAYEMTSMVHGKEEAEKAQNAARALFSGNAMDTEHMPSTQLTEADLTDGAIGILTLMVKAGLAASNGEARRLVVQGGVLADGEKVAAPTVSFTAEQLAKGIVIKKGKKIYHKVTL